MRPENFFSLADLSNGVFRELAPGITTRIFSGEHAMLSLVTIAPGARGTLHHHPEEQWGFCLEGSGLRIQGDDVVEIASGDFWRTPGGVPHTVESGPEGLVILDVFAPPRKTYTRPGSGFSDGD
jgi:quercetin dioxygenase-like cupin family protein